MCSLPGRWYQQSGVKREGEEALVQKAPFVLGGCRHKGEGGEEERGKQLLSVPTRVPGSTVSCF